MAPRHATIALVIRYVATCYKRWAVAHTYGHRCRTPARILHAPGHAQTMRLCRVSVWRPLRQRQGGDALAGWPIPAGPASARPPATIPQAGLGGKRGVGFCSFLQGGPGAERAPEIGGGVKHERPCLLHETTQGRTPGGAALTGARPGRRPAGLPISGRGGRIQIRAKGGTSDPALGIRLACDISGHILPFMACFGRNGPFRPSGVAWGVLFAEFLTIFAVCTLQGS